MNTTAVTSEFPSNYTKSNVTHFEFYKTEQIAMLSTLFVITVTGNTIVLLLLLINRKMTSRMHVFIANLAVADLLVGFFFLLTDIIWKATVDWHAGAIECKLIKFIQGASTYGSTYALVAMSLDRLDAIARPMHISGRKTRCRLLICLGWFFACLFSSPMLVTYKLKSIMGSLQCWMELPQEWMWKIYITLVAIAVFVIPAIVIAVCYVIIVIVIWSKPSMSMTTSTASSHHSHHMNCNGKSDTTGSGIGHKKVKWAEVQMSSRGLIPRAKIKTVKMTLVIVSVFILCWSPYFIFDLLFVYNNIQRTEEIQRISTFIQSLAPLNSAANPFIFLLFNTKLLRKCCGKAKNKDVQQRGLSLANRAVVSYSTQL